jgi:GntR family transcriptional repressor for pyruvate dehydrogenase complex
VTTSPTDPYNGRPRFEPIPRQTVSEGVREALLSSIKGGDLPPGVKLPSERALCEEFGVARTSLREAIQGLVSLGLIEKRGNGTFVTEQLPGLGLDGQDSRKRRIEELFEVRRVVEVPIARLATCRATPADRADIEAIAGSFSPIMELGEFRAADRAFHSAVARACGNETLAELYGKVLEAQFGSYELDSLPESSANRRAVQQVISDSTEMHQAIAAAIAMGDVDQAIKATENHLGQVESQLIARMV